MTTEVLILVRLLTAVEKGELASKVRKDLEPLLSPRLAGASLTEAIDRGFETLESSGRVERIPGKSKRAAPRFVATESGRHEALGALGVASLRPKTTWAALRKTYLPAAALGLPSSSESAFKAMSSDPVFRAIMLKRTYDLPTAEVPKLDEAIDALAWKLIGFAGETRKFDLKAVKTALLNRELAESRAADFKKAAARLAAKGAKARRDDGKELRDAVIRHWLANEPEPSQPPSEPPAPPTIDLATIAERTKAAARDCPTGRYGDGKVFIAHVWDRLQSDPAFAAMTLDDFKRAMAEANNLRLIDVARADLVQAMDRADVERSEVRQLGAVFHFIRL